MSAAFVGKQKKLTKMNFKLLRFFAFVLTLTVVLSSCNKDDNDITPNDGPNATQEDDTSVNFNQNENFQGLVTTTTSNDSLGCYELAFPMTFIYEDGTTVTANDEEELEEIFLTEPHPVEFSYPVNLVDPETGETAVANNEIELITLLTGCFDDDDWDDDDWGDDDWGDFEECFELVFPVSFVLEDGSTVTANSEDDLEDLFDEENPPVDFAYPVQFTDEDGEVFTVNNEEELEELFEDCEGDWDDDDFPCDGPILGDLDCYEFVFPLGFVLEDGTTVQVNSEDDFEDLFDPQNPPVNFDYPIQLENEDGEILTVNNEEELEELLEDCEDGWGGNDDDGSEHVYILSLISVQSDTLGVENCYTYVYPISLEGEDGSTVTINDENELIDVLFLTGGVFEDFVYPVQVIDNDSGETLTANDEEEVYELIEDCEP